MRFWNLINLRAINLIILRNYISSAQNLLLMKFFRFANWSQKSGCNRPYLSLDQVLHLNRGILSYVLLILHLTRLGYNLLIFLYVIVIQIRLLKIWMQWYLQNLFQISLTIDLIVFNVSLSDWYSLNRHMWQRYLHLFYNRQSGMLSLFLDYRLLWSFMVGLLLAIVVSAY